MSGIERLLSFSRGNVSTLEISVGKALTLKLISRKHIYIYKTHIYMVHYSVHAVYIPFKNTLNWMSLKYITIS